MWLVGVFHGVAFLSGVKIDSVEDSAVLLLLSEFDICISTRCLQLSLTLIYQISSIIFLQIIAYH